MKLKFYWYSDSEKLEPSCEIYDTHEKLINCLGGVLTDDGALSGQEKISWLLEGVAKFESIMLGSVVPLFWDRDSWGSEYIGDRKVRLYSMYDDNYFFDFPLEIFIRILKDWVDFNKSEPSFNTILNFEYSLDNS